MTVCPVCSCVMCEDMPGQVYKLWPGLVILLVHFSSSYHTTAVTIAHWPLLTCKTFQHVGYVTSQSHLHHLAQSPSDWSL